MRDARTKTARVRSVIAECNNGYRALGLNIFTASERVEELWFEIEDLLDGMERAEAARDSETVHDTLCAIYHKLNRIQAQLPEEYR